MSRKFKKGAASFYIVAFATMILMILALSFTAVIISEVTRTSNDDLSQSAYDSAMAGVEDAKLAFYNYQNCKAKNSNITPVASDGKNGMSCEEIVWHVENGMKGTNNYNKCDMVGRILGRIKEGEEGPVRVEENNVNNMQQAYTCTMLNNSLANYQSYVRSIDVTKLQFDGVSADKIKKVKISWGSDMPGLEYLDRNKAGMFRNNMPLPPTISFAILQTAETFHLSDFDFTRDGRTDRGMVYLVPQNDLPNKGNDRYNVATYDTSNNVNKIGKTALLDSNDKTRMKKPYLVQCNDNKGYEYICSTIIELPEPVGGSRSDNTFVVVVGNPAMNEDVKYSMEFYCDDGEKCARDRKINRDSTDTRDIAFLENVQIEIDSTGKANDLFRRVMTRYKSNSDYALSIMGPLELLGGGEDLNKDFSDDNGGDLGKNGFVTCEENFIAEPNCD